MILIPKKGKYLEEVDGTIPVRFVEDYPYMYPHCENNDCTEKTFYGPYKPGDIAYIPTELASDLLKIYYACRIKVDDEEEDSS